MTQYQSKEYNKHYFYFRFTLSNDEKYIFLSQHSSSKLRFKFSLYSVVYTNNIVYNFIVQNLSSKIITVQPL